MIAIIDYEAGNLRSIARAIEAAGESSIITADPADILAADAVCFPGDGAAGFAMRALDRAGLIDPIHEVVRRGVPFLGVCLGMQLLFGYQEENDTHGLGLLDGEVRLIRGAEKLPHIGWSETVFQRGLPGFDAGTADYFYFVHSYVAQPANPENVVGVTTYGEPFASIVARDNVWGTQFHPEKSGVRGLALVNSWIEFVRASRLTEVAAR
ncbi:MAG: imidazole glycerol phosphate synthase subunit HisH [Thermomicrobiales bacterium]|nr:imidazole glycerol phosphate synthase subunit HisH [Thermomicrobiales bacterium]